MKIKRTTLTAIAALVPLWSGMNQAIAASQSSGMPWEGPLQKLANSLTGPTAMYLSLICLFVTGCGLIWGSEFNEFFKKLTLVVFVLSLLIFAASFISMLFGVAGARIA